MKTLIYNTKTKTFAEKLARYFILLYESVDKGTTSLFDDTYRNDIPFSEAEKAFYSGLRLEKGDPGIIEYHHKADTTNADRTELHNKVEEFGRGYAESKGYKFLK